MASLAHRVRPLAPAAAALLVLPLASAASGALDDPTPAGRALSRARSAADGGDTEAAREHLERALAGASGATRAAAAQLLGELATRPGEEAPEDLCRAALTLADVTWREGFKPARDLKGARSTFAGPRTPAGEMLEAAADLAIARAGLAAELATLARERQKGAARAPEQLLTAAWARRFGLELTWSMPAAREELGPALDPRVFPPASPQVKVLKALDQLAERALGGGAPGTALLIGRAIKGLAVQADLSALRGPRPPRMARWRARAGEIIADAEARVLTDRPWTVEELEWLTSEEGEAFTRAHDSFSAPGVAVSPRGWYRIESDCGAGSLLAAARDAELHHERLVSYFGEDPFVTDPDRPDERRPGTIRIVPDPSGLEAEGTPFFWAGGFQSGDRTVVRLTVGTEGGLGRLLTHELTHRFDQEVHPGLPSWLAEGKAVWTAAAYGDASDGSFEPSYADHATMNDVRRRGFAGAQKLRDLVAGTPTDYRQNYAGGHALFVFLRTWTPGGAADAEPLFAGVLEAYEDRAKRPRPGPRRLAEFEELFCDGEEGRPGDFEGLRALFAEFLAGFDPRDPAPWLPRYRGSVEVIGGPRWIYDAPTWTWDWNRAEPRFGQNQARVAGRLLAQGGKDREATLAHVWARAVDGFDPRTAEALEGRLAAAKGRPAEEALFALRHERVGEPFASLAGVYGEGPRPGPFPTAPGAYGRYVEALEGARAIALELGAPVAAATLELEGRRAAAFMGEDVAPAVPGPLPRHRSVDLGGWRDEELVRLDQDRPEELFQIAEDGTVRLGRREGRSGSGSIERSGGGRSFVRADRWMLPGTYEVTANLRFTTGFNRVFAVLGWQTRDRNTRLAITAGDVEYASGETDEEPRFEDVGWRYDGMRPRDRGLPGSSRGGRLELPAPSTSVSLRLLVDGPMLTAWIQGERIGTYHVVDGQPIEGYVGFGTLHGAVNLTEVQVRRLDGLAGARAIHLVAGTGPPLGTADNASVALPDGLRPPSNGALVLTIPSWSPGDPAKGLRANADASLERAARIVRDLARGMERNGHSQPLWVFVPGSARDSDKIARLEEALRGGAGVDGDAGGSRILFHGFERPEGAPPTPDGGKRWLMLVDPCGAARAVQPWTTVAVLDRGRLHQWMLALRDNGEPARELPAPEREE